MVVKTNERAGAQKAYDSGELLSPADAPISGVYASEVRAFRYKKQHNYPSYLLSTHNCGLYVLVYFGAQYIKTNTSLNRAP